MSGYAHQAAAKKGPPAAKERPEPRRPDRTKPMKFDNEGGKCGNPAEDNWRPGKRMNIQAQDTGRIQNKTIVSVESPDWMKSFFENNRTYFEQKGIAQKLKKPAGGEHRSSTSHAAGIGSSARAQGKKVGAGLRDETGAPLSPNLSSEASPDWMNSARKWTKIDKQAPGSWQRAGEDGKQDRFTFMVPKTKCRSANNMQHLVVSEQVPEWMQVASAMEAVAKETPRRARSADDLSRPAGVDTHRIWDQSYRNKATGTVHPSTGRVNYSTQQSPDFPLDSGLEHRQAFEETVRSAPNSARRDNSRIAAGDKFKDRRSKKGAVVDEDTGKVANYSIISVESPQWMKQPFESNRTFFEKQGVAEKLRTMSTEEHESKFTAGRRVPARPKQVFKQVKNEEGKIQNLSIVSVGAPQWMKSPFESNRPYFESQGIAQRRAAEAAEPASDCQEAGGDSRRSSSAPPRSSKVPGPPSHAAERAKRSRKSASEASTASRRTSSATGTSYSARYTTPKQMPRQSSASSLQSARG